MTLEPQAITTAATGLRVRGLWKSFGQTRVLQGIDLEVNQGKLVTVLGASGSGKTTLLRLLCGFERADAGRIELGERTVAHGAELHVAPEKRGVGYVAQEGALFPHLSVAENILFGLPRHLRKAGRSENLERVLRLLELMDLPSYYARRMPAALSGGEQQRVALARALAPKPAVVLLDEPFSALDAGLRAETRAAVVASLKRVDATALLVTHDQDEALSMSDQVAVLQNGRLAQVADPQTLYRFPVNREVARFVGEAVLVPGTIHGDSVECCFGHLLLATEMRALLPAGTAPVDVMIRPEQFRLYVVEPDLKHSDGPAHLAQVEKLSFYGHDAQIALCLECGVRFRASVPGINLPTPGDQVRFRVIGPVIVYPRESGSVNASLPAEASLDHRPAAGGSRDRAKL
ncbi:MAG: ABC transporter ATP-binding protein [Gammaproteobacteria bacterium]